MSDDPAPKAEPTPDAPASGKTFTQDEFNALLAREKGKLQAKYEGHDDLKAKAARYDELAESQKTELQKATDLATSATQRADQAEIALLRLQVAAEKNLDPKHAHRLVGKTRKELETDAEALAVDFPRVPVPGLDPGAARETAAGGDMNSIIRQAAGRPG